MITLGKDEVLEDLQRDNFFIIQNHKEYCFSSDSVLLSDFAKVDSSDKVVEFCSGCGVISILLFAKYGAKDITGFEVQEELCNMSKKSLEYNNIDSIKFLNKDLKSAPSYYKNDKVDVVVCNPPYYKLPRNYSNISRKNLIAKYELNITLNDILRSASSILKDKGKFYIVYTSTRLQELLKFANDNNLICKTLQFVYPKFKNSSTVVLGCFIKNANKGVDIIKPLYI